jgi:hypothetical protein
MWMLDTQVPTLKPAGALAHQLRRGEAVVVHLGRDDCFEPGVFGFTRDRSDVDCPPPDTRNDPQAQSFGASSRSFDL